jgi:hypothetical protein
MLVNSLNKQAFGSSQVYRDVLLGKRNFYSLSTDDKLNVIYDKLNSLEKDHRGLSENQIKMNDFNKEAFDCLLAASSRNSRSSHVAYNNIKSQYECNKLNVVG